jgi:antitoxin component YwqK of YwqJK toxin-antitoxin module
LKKASVFLSLILALFPAVLCAGEDRVETINGAKGFSELVYQNDVLAEKRSYDAEGILLEEKTFGQDSLPIYTSSYIRKDKRLVKVEVRDASGDIVGSRAYQYDRDGRLLGVATDGVLGEGAAGMVSSGGTPQGSWTETAVTTTVLGYDESGRAVVIQTMREGKAVSIERRTYGKGGLLSSVATEDKASGLSAKLLYDESGRQSQRKDVPAKGPEINTLYRYDESGRLAEEFKRAGIHSTLIRRTYAEDGSLSRIETSRDGELLLTVEYREDGRMEELYDNGILFVRATYIGGRKVKDEFYSEGVLVRSRDYL